MRSQVIEYGAATRIRTGDPRITNALLYQLSYCGNRLFQNLFNNLASRFRTHQGGPKPPRVVEYKPGRYTLARTAIPP
jgi:hypothetical protein